MSAPAHVGEQSVVSTDLLMLDEDITNPEARQHGLTVNVFDTFGLTEDQTLEWFYAYNRLVNDPSNSKSNSSELVLCGVVSGLGIEGKQTWEIAIDDNRRPTTLSENQISVIGAQAIGLDKFLGLKVEHTTRERVSGVSKNPAPAVTTEQVAQQQLHVRSQVHAVNQLGVSQEQAQRRQELLAGLSKQNAWLVKNGLIDAVISGFEV